MKRKLLVLVGLVALISLLSPFAQVFAATSEEITLDYTPAYLDVSTTPTTWSMNGIAGNGVVEINTVYYANPLGDTTPPSATVLDGECRFTTTNSSTIDIDATLNIPDSTGGSDPMVNSNDGSNGVGTFGAYVWYSGMTYSSKVVAESTGSTAFLTSQTALTDYKWGIEVETQTDQWTGGTQSSSTMVHSIAAS